MHSGGNLRHVAHVRRDVTGSWLEHALHEHLEKVGRLAGEFARSFDNEDWATLAGRWHDLGKYKAAFQSYIRDRSGFERDEADEGGPGRVDHTAAGAIHAVEQLGELGRILAYLIAGHHSGLPDWYKIDAPGRSLQERLSDRRHLEETLAEQPPAEVLAGERPSSPPCGRAIAPEHAHLWVRMLFSCLVDADFLDTEAFMDLERPQLRGSGHELADLLTRFDAHMASKEAGAADTPVNRVRRQVLADCRDGAQRAPGLFSLTVPTGGGKTLASMGFALNHALAHGKRRVIVVIPYTSIIEQTAEVLRGVFGTEAVLEHHSNIDPDRDSLRSKLATENWDAPIVVTTNVRLFESLYAARTSACRKLHNIANSVIILDEAQMLPPEFLKPILSVLRGLVESFGTTAVLCTATQPALTGHIGSASHGSKGGFAGLSNVVELMRDPDELAQKLRRVEVLPPNLRQVSQWSDVAQELAKERQVLCIVNTRRDCRDLHSLLPDDAIHLSALMCGEHRSQVIQDLKQRLREGAALRVVSTQLVEAGVDLDFPVVYRAMAGLDSIAQAAGRCNREGTLPDDQLGRVVIFVPPKPAPMGLLRQGEDAAKEMFRISPQLAASLRPDAFRQYFKQFYSRVHGFDAQEIMPLLMTDAHSFQFQFRTAASKFRMIDDKGQRAIIVWYKRDRANGKTLDSKKIIEQLKRVGPFRTLMRRLQRCTVNVPERVWSELASQGAIEELRGPDGPLDLWAQALPGLYDATFGLRVDGPEFQGDEFVL